jgi:F-type H+-transporting ATPase subunit beta
VSRNQRTAIEKQDKTMSTNQGSTFSASARWWTSNSRSAMPKVYDALTLDASATHSGVEAGLTFEVQQQLGDGVVHHCARLVGRPAPRHGREQHRRRDLGAGGKATLGRIMDVLGRPIDERGPPDQSVARSIKKRR